MMPDYSRYSLTRKEKRDYLITAYIGIFAFIFIFYQSVLLSFSCGFLCLAAQKVYTGYLAEKRRELLLAQFRDLLYSLSASIMAGRQMAEALREASENLSLIYKSDTPLRLELDYMVTGIFENRRDEMELLNDFARRSGCADIQSFVDVYFACRTTGGNVEKVIEKTSDVLMEKLIIQKEIKTLTAQKKLEGKIISAMPVIVIFTLNLTSPEYLQVLYSTLTGRVVMTIALGGMIYAYTLINKYTKIKV